MTEGYLENWINIFNKSIRKKIKHKFKNEKHGERHDPAYHYKGNIAGPRYLKSYFLDQE